MSYGYFRSTKPLTPINNEVVDEIVTNTIVARMQIEASPAPFLRIR